MDDSPALRFGRFELQARHRRLLQADEPLTIGARAFDLLLALAERRDRVVPKAELLDLVWPGLVVEENNLQVQVSTLRRLLGPQAISTVPGRGYRFTAAVTDGAEGALSVAPSLGGASVETESHTHSLGNLPAALPPLYGRHADLVALGSLIESHSLVTVVGAGGIGKSRLAQAAAHQLAGRWPDGAWMVELAGLSDPVLVANAVAQVLGIRTTGRGAALGELAAGVAARKLLLVLDNCEHLLDAVVALAQALMQAAPSVTMLATSQEPLHLPTEQQYRVMPLAVPTGSMHGADEFGAVALFDARARAVDPRFTLNGESLPIVVDICRRLDGLPLAIELAAARVASLGLRTVRDKLDARFKLLTGGSRAALRRHQTLRAALEWSHNLLDVADQAVFRRLGVFAGGFTMELAQAVAADPQLDEWAVLEHLSALVDKSLVVVDPGQTPRYRLLESARAFALEQLATADETAEVLKRHAKAIRSFIEEVDGRSLDGELRTDELQALLLPEWDNVRAAHAWAVGENGDLEVAVALAASANVLEEFAFESTDWLVLARRQVEGGALSQAVIARYWRAMASANVIETGRVPRALQLDAADRARAIYRSLGLPLREFSSAVLLGFHCLSQGQDAAAQAAADEARRLARPHWPGMLRIRLLRLDISLASKAGRQGEALALCQEAVLASAATGDWLLEMIAREYLADLLWRVGRIEDAAREWRNLVDELRARPLSTHDMTSPFTCLMSILAEMGRMAEAAATAREAFALMHRAQSGHYLEHWVYLFWRLERMDDATRILGASDAARTRHGSPRGPNEQRLANQARSALEAGLAPGAFAGAMAAGAALGEADVLALISSALVQAGLKGE